MNRPFALLLILLAGLNSGCGNAPSNMDLLRARNASLMGNWPFARQHYERHLSKHPKDCDARRELRHAWHTGTEQNLSSRILAVETYLQYCKPELAAQIELARALLIAGDWQRARQKVEQLPVNTQTVLLHLDLAIQLDSGQIEPLIQKALQYRPADPNVHLRALTYFLNRHPDRALQHAEQLVSLGDPATHAHFQIAQAYLRSGKSTSAEKHLNIYQLMSVIEANRADADIFEKLEGLIAPVPLAAQLSYAGNLLNSGFHQRGRERFDTLISNSSLSRQEKLLAARHAERLGLAEQPMVIYHALVTEDPDDAEAGVGLARHLVQLGPVGQARELVDSQVVRHPHVAWFHYLAGTLDARENNTQAAAEALARAIDLAPWKVSWRIELVNLLVGNGMVKQATRIIDQAPTITPTLRKLRVDLSF